MKRSKLLSATVVVMTIMGIGGAWLGVQFFFATDEVIADSPPQKPVKVLEFVRDEGNGPMTLRITVEPADDLPAGSPQTGGVLVGQEDDLLSVGTGNIELDIEVEIVEGQSPEETISLSHSGPVETALINENTIIYRDTTPLDVQPSETLNGEITIQQEIEQVEALPAVIQNLEVQVWGHLDGDQIVADVVVYHQVK
ncbi:MAG: hypothetical protein AAF485_00115 [Chloroflexota bacterium]